MITPDSPVRISFGIAAPENFINKSPKIRKIYEENNTWKEYSSTLQKRLPGPRPLGKLGRAIIDEAQRLLPHRISIENLEKQLINYRLISTADHHGLLNYKLLYNSNILFSRLTSEFNPPFLIVPSSGNIPLTNISYPRGFYFKNKKFNFFSERKSRGPVFLFDGRIAGNEKKGLSSFISNLDSIPLTKDELNFLEYLFFHELEIHKISQEVISFQDQISLLNFKLWKYFFRKDIRSRIPDILYLQVNKLIEHVLMDELRDKNSLISSILFNREIRNEYLKRFNGIRGAWGDEGKGSHFFWGIDENQRFINLVTDANWNLLKGENFKLDLIPEAVMVGLEKKQISPTLFMDFLIIAFLEGYVCLGGSNQLDYLPLMQGAHVSCLNNLKMTSTAEDFSKRITDGLICGLIPFEYGSGMDLIWEHNSHNGKFNGNLDEGLSEEKLKYIDNLKMQKLIENGIEYMNEIV